MAETLTLHRTIVRVTDLPLLADIGINPDEIGRRQPLIVSVELVLNVREIQEIAQTIDYRKIANAAEELALVHIPLIETFAQRLGKICLSYEGASEVEVSISKPFALLRGLAGVKFQARKASILKAGQKSEQ